MEIDVFVSEAIKNIIKGMVDAQEFAKDYKAIVNPIRYKSDDNQIIEIAGIKRHLTIINFDIAVTASIETEAGGKAALKVMSVELGGNKSNVKSEETASRIKFDIGVVLPQLEGNNYKFQISVG